jgi:hypothetical protein
VTAPKRPDRFWGGLGRVLELGPGIYSDSVGNLHLDVGQILAHLGFPDTPANRVKVAEHLTRNAQSLAPASGATR